MATISTPTRVTRSQTAGSVLGKRSSSTNHPSSSPSPNAIRTRTDAQMKTTTRKRASDTSVLALALLLPTVACGTTTSTSEIEPTTPKPKRARVSLSASGSGSCVVLEEDGASNKENVPPLSLVILTPRSQRIVRRTSSGLSPSPSPGPNLNLKETPRRTASISMAVPMSTSPTIPKTPSTALANLSLSQTLTPPATPPVAPQLQLVSRVRAALRSMSNANAASGAMSVLGRERERGVVREFIRGIQYQRSCVGLSSREDGEDANITQDTNEHEHEVVLYISGSPGTGKTALVNDVMHSALLDVDDVRVVFLNCMAFASAEAVWERLGEEFVVCEGEKGGNRKVGAKGRVKGKKEDCKTRAMRALESRDVKTILILDELDHLPNASVILQSLFAHAIKPSASLRIIGIANTHTLTSANSLAGLFCVPSTNNMNSKSNSKSPTSTSSLIKTIHFAPYTPPELLSILHTRFEAAKLPQEEMRRLIPGAALNLLTRKVAAVTGDVRVLFEVLRGALDAAVNAATAAAPGEVVVSPSHILTALKAYAPSSSAPLASSGLGSGPGLGAAMQKGAGSETATKVRGLGLQARLVLLALLIASKRVAASLALCSSSSSPSASPTKKASLQRSRSLASIGIKASTEHSLSVDATQLHAFYTSLLSSADSFVAVTRSEFTDLLGLLETTGLVVVATSSSSSSGSGVSMQRGFKRSSSFGGRMRSGGGGVAEVRFGSEVRVGEVARGLGVASGSGAGEGGDVREEEVRRMWEAEVGRIRREVKLRAREALKVEVDAFDDAMED